MEHLEVRLENNVSPKMEVVVCSKYTSIAFLIEQKLFRDYGHIPICNSLKEYKISRNKLNQGSEEPLQWKL